MLMCITKFVNYTFHCFKNGVTIAISIPTLGLCFQTNGIIG